jgi:hypothetical protein
MANYQAARALMGKGRNAGEGAAGLSKSSAKKSAVKKSKPNATRSSRATPFLARKNRTVSLLQNDARDRAAGIKFEMCVSAGRDFIPINCSTRLIDKGSVLANGIGFGLAVPMATYRYRRYCIRWDRATARDPVGVYTDVGDPKDVWV